MSACKKSACNAEDPGSISGLGSSPGEGIGYPLQHSCLEYSHEQRSLAGYSSLGYKNQTQLSDRTTMNIVPTPGLVCGLNKILIPSAKSTSSQRMPSVSWF